MTKKTFVKSPCCSGGQSVINSASVLDALGVSDRWICTWHPKTSMRFCFSSIETIFTCTMNSQCSLMCNVNVVNRIGAKLFCLFS